MGEVMKFTSQVTLPSYTLYLWCSVFRMYSLLSVELSCPGLSVRSTLNPVIGRGLVSN